MFRKQVEYGKFGAERYNFPTDIYMTEGLISVRGNKHELKLIEDPRDILDNPEWLQKTAVVLLTHVSYCTGRMLGMKAITQKIHEA